MSKVLLIDDDPVVIDVYREVFAAAGFEVCTAADGEEGLFVTWCEGPDAIVLDVSLPKLDGWRCLARIRSDERFGDLPVIILTSGEVAAELNNRYNPAATMIVSKKSAPQRVVDAVIEVMVSGNWRTVSASAA